MDSTPNNTASYPSNTSWLSSAELTEEDQEPGVSIFMLVILTLYALICLAGTVGNGLVILVVLRYSNMRSVTNTYIFNLAVSDFFFLVGVPFLIVTAVSDGWIFGAIMCKLFYILTSLNWFTSVFTLTVLSADRYLAVCHPISSMGFRSPLIARVICLVVWISSFLVMMPIFLYAKTVDQSYPLGNSTEDGFKNITSCTIEWPHGQMISADQAFIWYAFCLSFAIPVSLISVFYFLVVNRLRKTGPTKKTKGKKKSQKKVTVMVLSVITVYVVCWSPYWIFQMTMLFVASQPSWARILYQFITVMSYTNSALNPVLYAFLSDNFRKTFAKACKCAGAAEVNRTLLPEQAMSTKRKEQAEQQNVVPVAKNCPEDNGTGSNQTGTGSSQTGTGSNQPGTGSIQTGIGSSQTGTGSSQTGTTKNSEPLLIQKTADNP